MDKYMSLKSISKIVKEVLDLKDSEIESHLRNTYKLKNAFEKMIKDSPNKNLARESILTMFMQEQYSRHNQTTLEVCNSLFYRYAICYQDIAKSVTIANNLRKNDNLN